MDQIELARELAAIAQSGLHFTDDVYDRERYERLRGIASELLEQRSNMDRSSIVKWMESDFGYATPKVDVRAFILQSKKVFLIREDQDEGRWTLPGGWADVNLPPSENVIREVLEESGYEVAVKGLLAVYDREKQGHQPSYPYHIYKMFFECEIIGGAPVVNHESSACGFFALDDLPELSTSRVLRSQIEKFYEIGMRGEKYTTDYD